MVVYVPISELFRPAMRASSRKRCPRVIRRDYDDALLAFRARSLGVAEAILKEEIRGVPHHTFMPPNGGR